MSGRFVRGAAVVAAAIGIVLLALAVAAVFVVRGGTANEWLRAHLAERIGPSVHFAGAEVVWSPRPALQLDDVRLVPDPADDDPPDVAARRVTCSPQLAPLWHGEVVLDEVRVDGLRVSAAVDTAAPGGGDPIAAVLAWIRDNALPGPLPEVRIHDGDVAIRLDAAGGAAPAPGRELRAHLADAQLTPDGAGARLELAAALQPSGSLSARLGIDSLAAADRGKLTAAIEVAQLDAANLQPWLPPDVADIDLTGSLRLSAQASRDGSAPVAAAVLVELADGAVDAGQWRIESPLRASGRVDWDGGVVSISDGTLQAARASGAGASAESVDLAFDYGNGALRIAKVQFAGLGGSWNGAGRVAIATPVSFDATLAGRDVDCAAVGALLEPHARAASLPSCDGQFQISATGSGTAGGAWNAGAQLGTGGAVRWPDGRADGPVSISADLVGEATALRSASGTAAAPRVVVGTVTAQAVSVAYEYEDGALRVAPARAGTFGGTWTYTGSLPIGAGPWSGELGATRVDAAALATALGGGLAAAAPRGSVDATAKLNGNGTSAVSAAATLRLSSASLSAVDALRVDAPAQIGATVRYLNGRTRVSDGQLRAQRVQYGPIAAGAVAARFSGDDGGALQVTSAEATVFGGRWQGNATATLGRTLVWNGALQATQIDFNALLRAADALDDDTWPRSPHGVADITAQVRQEPDGDVAGTADVRLKAGTFHWDKLDIDAPAHASGAFTAVRGDLSLSGVDGSAARARYGVLVGTEVTGQLGYAHATDRLTFQQLRFRSAGGQCTHSGWFTLAERGRFGGQLTAEGVQPHALAEMLDETELDIPFAHIDLDTQFDGVATPQWKEHLGMVGSVLLRDGTLPAAAILRPIWNALIGPGRMSNLVDQPTRVAHVSDSFTLRDQRFDTTDLSLVSNDYTVTGVGSVGMDGDLDLETRIQLTSSGMQKMFFFAALPFPTGALPSLPPIPARATGTLADPVIRPNAGALPASTVRWFVSAVLETPGSVASNIAEPIRRFWNGLFGSGAAEPDDHQAPATPSGSETQ